MYNIIIYFSEMEKTTGRNFL